MRSVAFAGGLAAVLAAAAPSRADDEWERDLDRGVGARVLVVDRCTGRAVAGARLRHFAEVVSEQQKGHREILPAAVAPLLRVVRAGEHGLAWIDTEKWHRGGHWLVDAPGYAATHEWGDTPGEVVQLLPPRTLHFRLLDAAGRPVPGAQVEAYLGCPHAPPLTRTRSDAEGRVRLEGAPPGDAFLWVEAEGSFAWTPGLPGARTWVGGERAVVLSAGVVAEGVVVDLDGTPLAGVVVRGAREERGPAQLTGEDGRFRIVGLTLDSGLEFVHPAGERGPSVLDADRWTAGAPRRVVLTPWEVVEPGGPRRLVRVRVTRENGAPVNGIPVRLVREEDGWTLAEETDDDPPDAEIGDDEDAGESLFALPHGTYRLDRPTAWREHDLELARFVVGAGDGELHVPVRATTRPRLAIRGEVPARATVTLAIAGTETELDEDEVSGNDPVHLPADAAATLRVRAGDGTWFFEVGPVRDGLRDVEVHVPAPREVVITGSGVVNYDEVTLVDEGFECGPGCRTSGTGQFVVRFSLDGTPLAEVPISLGADSPERIELPIPAAEGSWLVPYATVFVAGPSEDPPWVVDVAVFDDDGSEFAAGVATPTQAVRFPFRGRAAVRAVRQRPGYVTATAIIHLPGEHTLRWGDSAVSLSVRTSESEPVAATLLLDGWESSEPEDPAEPLVLRGLPAGPVELVVLPRDSAYRPKALRLVLRPGEVRTRDVVLVAR